jgi:hypothetical protein
MVRPRRIFTVKKTTPLLLALGSLLPLSHAQAISNDGLQQCIAIQEDAKRLSCFDKLAAARPAPVTAANDVVAMSPGDTRSAATAQGCYRDQQPQSPLGGGSG